MLKDSNVTVTSRKLSQITINIWSPVLLTDKQTAMTFKDERLADEVCSEWTYDHQHTEEKQLLKYLHRCFLDTTDNIRHAAVRSVTA